METIASSPLAPTGEAQTSLGPSASRAESRMQSPKVAVFCGQTGGTLASTAGDGGHGNKKPTTSLNDLIRSRVPEVMAYAELVVPDVGEPDCVKSLIDSTEADVDHFAECIRIHFRKFKEPFAGHVHTTGTDILAEKAAAFSIALRKPTVPIIITGAQRGFNDRHSDAAANLRNAVFAAAHRQMPPGVFVVFNHRIIDASVVEKRSTISLDAFASHNRDDLGSVDAPNCFEIRSGVHHGWTAGVPEMSAEFDPFVKIEQLTASYNPAWLEDVLNRDDVHGLIIRAFGLGGIPGRLLPVLNRHADRKPIVVQSQCADGPTNLDEYKVGVLAAETGVLCTGALSPAYATLLLQHLLAVTDGLNHLRQAWNSLVHYRLGAATPTWCEPIPPRPPPPFKT
jgi:L-asparaginase